MKPTYVLSVAVAALALIFGYGMLASDGWSPTATAEQLAANETGSPADRQDYEVQTERTLGDMDRRMQELGQKPDVPQYDNLESAWAAVKNEWQTVKASTAEDWRDAKASFERDWNAFQKKWVEVTAKE